MTTTSKRFIFITRYFYPSNTGIARIVSDLAFELTNKGYEVHVITSNQGYESEHKDLLAKETLSGVNITRISALPFRRTSFIGRIINYLGFYYSCVLKLWNLLKKDDVVVVLSEPPLIATFATAMIKLRRAKLVNWVQDIHPEGAQHSGVRLAQGWMGRMLRSFRNISWKNAIVNIVLGQRMAELIQTQGISTNQIAIYPNWEDGEFIQPLLPENNILRNEWLFQDKFVVGYSGNLGRAYEFKTILDAADYLLQQNHASDIVFLFIGDGYHKKYLEEQIKQRKLTNVILKSYQPREQLRESLNVPDIHLISTRPEMEGTLVPGKLCSAMAVGKPILFVGDHDGETARILRSANCGETVTVGDAVLLANTIIKLRNDSHLCDQLGRNSRMAFDKHFDKSVAMGRLYDFLVSIG